MVRKAQIPKSRPKSTKTTQQKIKSKAKIVKQRPSKARSTSKVKDVVRKQKAVPKIQQKIIKKSDPVEKVKKVDKWIEFIIDDITKEERNEIKKTIPEIIKKTIVQDRKIKEPTHDIKPKPAGKDNFNKQEDEVRKTESITFVSKVPKRADSRATAGIVDVVFCCDTTSSMRSYLEQTKETVRSIVKNIKDKSQNKDISVRFGFVCYRDHLPPRVQDLCTDEEILKFIEKQSANGGGNIPEALLDGLYDAATKISWRDSMKTPSLRYIFHIADAPSHGSEFDWNNQWNNGLPYLLQYAIYQRSGVTLAKVVHVINIREIHYRLIQCRKKNLNLMACLFKQNFTNFDETRLQHANDLNIRVSDMIIRELLPNVNYGYA